MLCNKLIYVTYSNLVSENTKSCSSCGKKTTNYKQECEILERLKNGEKKSDIVRDFNIGRSVLYRIIKENTEKGTK